MLIIKLSKRGCDRNEERGVAYIELALILAVLFPTVIAFIFFLLPTFSRRSAELTNAYAALGSCLLDPIRLYRFEGGRLVLRDDYEQVVQKLLLNCELLSRGQTTCAYLFGEQGEEIYSYKMNEDPERKCTDVDFDVCAPGLNPRSSIVLALWPSNANPICDYTYGTDPGAGSIDTGGGGGGGTGQPIDGCPQGYVQYGCVDPGLGSLIPTYERTCCKSGTMANGTGCSGCPPDTHICTLCDASTQTCKTSCVKNTDPNYGSSCPTDSSNDSSSCPIGTLQCLIAGSLPMCCPDQGFGTCLIYEMDPLRAKAECKPPDSRTGSPPSVDYCPETPPFRNVGPSDALDGCDYSLKFFDSTPCTNADAPSGGGSMLDVPGGSC